MKTPVEKLEKEHDVIERMLTVLKDNIDDIEAGNLSMDFITKMTDFFFIYTDKYHHTKETKIIIPKLKEKNIKDIDRMIMNELIEEHKYVAKVVQMMVAAKEIYESEKDEALNMLSDSLWRLFRFYPLHAEKEHTNFFQFIPIYFSEKEQQSIAKAIDDLNKEFDCEYHENIVTEFEEKYG